MRMKTRGMSGVVAACASLLVADVTTAAPNPEEPANPAPAAPQATVKPGQTFGFTVNPAAIMQGKGGGVAVEIAPVAAADDAASAKAGVEKKAQETLITLKIKDTAVGAALDAISKAGGIAIKQTDIPADAPKVTFDLENVSVLQGVKVITALNGLTYAFTDDGIVVSGAKKEEKTQ